MVGRGVRARNSVITCASPGFTCLAAGIKHTSALFGPGLYRTGFPGTAMYFRDIRKGVGLRTLSEAGRCNQIRLGPPGLCARRGVLLG